MLPSLARITASRKRHLNPQHEPSRRAAELPRELKRRRIAERSSAVAGDLKWRVAGNYWLRVAIMKQSSVESGRSRAFRFERIEGWQLARAFNRSVYHATRGFPKDEMFALTSQMRRASVSVSSNIAEGSGRNSDADFAHFLEIAYGSLMEVVSQLFIALDESYLTEAQFEALADEADVLAGKIVALSKALGRKPRIVGRLPSRAESGASRA